MPRSWFDFGNIGAALAGSQPDNTELFQAITGVNLIDGLGRTLYMTQFNSGMAGWVTFNSAAALEPYLAGGGIGINPNIVGQSYTCVLDAGIVAGHTARLEKYLSLYDQHQLGIEIGYRIIGNPPNLQIGLNHRMRGRVTYRAIITIQHTLDIISILTEAGNIVLTGISMSTLPAGTEIQVKMVIDTNLGRYLRFMFNDRSLQVRNIALQEGTALVDGYYMAQIAALNSGTTSRSLRIGYVRLTRDEP